MRRKGLILAGGTGSRLFPTTLATCKQLLPIYDKPMIYYSLSTLMLCGITDIAVICAPNEAERFRLLLADGRQWGIHIQYVLQEMPNGLPEAYILAEDFLEGMPSVLILGDNIFHGHSLHKTFWDICDNIDSNAVISYWVADPSAYGVLQFGSDGLPVKVIEKPDKFVSNLAVTGIYFLDSTATIRAKSLKKSLRGEYEIADLLNSYTAGRELVNHTLGRGFTWLDMGTADNLIAAANYVKTIQSSQGLLVGSPDEIAFRMGWITSEELLQNSKKYKDNFYGKYMRSLAHSP